MQTIKTGVVVALLLAVCYGAFVALNGPEPTLPSELLSEFDWNPDEAGLGNLMDIEMPSGESLAAIGMQPAAGHTGGSMDSSLVNNGLNGLTIPNPPTFGSASPGNFAAANTAVALPNSNVLNSAINTPQATLSSAGSMPLPSLPGWPNNAAASVATLDGPAVPLGGSPGGTLVSQTRKPGPENSDSTLQLPLLGETNTAGGMAPAGGPNASSSSTPSEPFPAAKERALELASSGKLREALQLMSPYYNSPELNHTQHSDLVDLLDALSREVIYSTRHLAQTAHMVTASDSVASVAEKFKITPELLTAVNRLSEDSKALIPGSQIKVLPGPFRAHVSLNRGELTIFMGDLYAGRFPVSLGKDPSPMEGSFEIVDRRRDRTYYGTGGKVIAAADSRNPYGGYWMNLGQDLCIHGTPEMASEDLKDAGCISLAPLDAADVYKILAQGSQVTIAR